MNEQIEKVELKTAFIEMEGNASNAANIEKASTKHSPSISQAETLWNQFLKNISKERKSAGQSKYPNPDVPEFFPRSSYTNVTSSTKTESKKIDDEQFKNSDTTGKNVEQFFNKNDLLVQYTSQQYLKDVTAFKPRHHRAEPNIKFISRVTENTNGLPGVGRYYWAVPQHIPRCLNFEMDEIRVRSNRERGSPTFVDFNKVKPKTTSLLPISAQELQFDLMIKNQQLAHLNNVVKALLDEIWKINELSMKEMNAQQWKSNLRFAVDEFLKPTTELGFHCADCCDRLKDFITRVSKQLERKIAKQFEQYKNNFIEEVLSVVENSLHSLIYSYECDFKSTLVKRNVYTQTDGDVFHWSSRKQTRIASRQSNSQITKIYRNRNFCRGYRSQQNGRGTFWFPTTMHSNDQKSTEICGHTNIRQESSHQPQTYLRFQQRSQPYVDVMSNTINPIQLIHQKYKNLNCRLEGIPDKNLIKFSYIVDGKEYSAVASTKKEAQYHCAWHVLSTTSRQ
ncbi:hypothetical protein PGB90_006469 [Kerria lacca]